MNIGHARSFLTINNQESNVLRTSVAFDIRVESKDIQSSCHYEKLTLPWTYLISDGKGLYIQALELGPNKTCGFKTKRQADFHRWRTNKILKDQSTNTIYLVTRGKDIREIDAEDERTAFYSPIEAYGHILDDQKLFGPNFNRTIYFGIQKDGELYCVVRSTGYEIKSLIIKGDLQC